MGWEQIRKQKRETSHKLEMIQGEKMEGVGAGRDGSGPWVNDFPDPVLESKITVEVGRIMWGRSME